MKCDKDCLYKSLVAVDFCKLLMRSTKGITDCSLKKVFKNE